MTGFEAFMLLPLWARVLLCFFFFDVIVALMVAAIRVSWIARDVKRLAVLHETALQGIQAINADLHKITRTLSLMLGMQISERDRRQAKEDEEATDKSNKKLSA